MPNEIDPRLVIVESPYGSDDPKIVERNERYARACMADCLRRGEAPFASHLLYTQEGVLDDQIPEERRKGIAAGLAWGERAAASVVYIDLGVTPGMEEGINRANICGRPVEVRHLGGEWAPCDCPGAVYDDHAAAMFDPDPYDCARCGHMIGSHCGPNGECTATGTAS